jgi:uncharacterized repeat protein (TIGR03803 family)
MSLRFTIQQLHKMIRSKPLLAAASILLLGLSVVPLAQAGTGSFIYSFGGGTDGQWPVGGLVRGADGNYYGTTQAGGAANAGTIFRLTPAGVHTVLHSFSGSDGRFPSSTLTIDSHGVIYGTTYAGGASGLGTVFQLALQPCAVCASALGQWKLTTLHSFTGTPDGRFPVAGLTADAHGNLYGTTGYGGSYDGGTVFKLDAHGNETLVYSFSGAADGGNPFGPLTFDSQGNLYGTTTTGGADGMGTVFNITPAGVERVVHSFAGPNAGDGANPYYTTLTMDASGNIYGTTAYGGSTSYSGPTGGGVIFQISSSGSESVLYGFCSQQYCADGLNPTAGVVRASDGSLYGTTAWGYYEGVLYQFANGEWIGLAQFSNISANGLNPVSPMVQDPSGKLYGTTLIGSGINRPLHAQYWGTVFTWTP